MPYFAIAASVSPPPAIENAAELAIASASVFVPLPNWSNSNTPTGPFQTIVLAFSSWPASAFAVSGPMSRIMSSASMSATFFTVAAAVGENSFATTTSVGIGTDAPRLRASSMIAFASPTRSASASDLPIASPAASMNVFAMPPPTIN
ncbi:Uncharacterised protein [Burkholderia pseudomallei]|nr:Uncharacterised protein [Burkholderia pseudomallei]CAK1566409.1 Uncharacterised protein [Burkholderia pseudomallei]